MARQKKTIFRQYSKWIFAAFALIFVGVASAAVLTPSKQASYNPTLSEKFAVYRTTDQAWIEASLPELEPLDLLLMKGRAFHVKERFNIQTGNLATWPLSKTTKKRLERHVSQFDPENLNFPAGDAELVYAKWRDTEHWTFQPIKVMEDGQRFFYEGREFITSVNLGNDTRQVKPTGNVYSRVITTMASQHENRIRLTLYYPELDTRTKIVTTHEHPFYVPNGEGLGDWVEAKFLTAGTTLETCDGSPARVDQWEELDEPIYAYNLEVEHTHNYYVADPDNPDAPAVLVHNAGPCGNNGNYVDLATPSRRVHILDGDATGGGHRPGLGKPGKSEFPNGWSDDKIMHNISDIATDSSLTKIPAQNGRTITEGFRGGLQIRVIQNPDGSIVTGYPLNVKRNPKK